jgi:hypothetical protein
MDEPVAVRDAVRNAVRNNRDVTGVTLGATPPRARRAPTRKRDTLRYLRAGAIWTALPVRDQRLLLWLLQADLVTAQLAALLVYGQLRTAQRRLARLSEYGLVTGFWTAGVQRPRGRYAYALTPAARLEIERLVWPDGRPARAIALPPSPPIHQLASHDLLAAFLRTADETRGEGLFAWIPERPASELFGGYVRPDAIAGVRAGKRASVLFIERDLGSERGEVLPGKIRRYRSLFAARSPLPLSVGFVVESGRRERSIQYQLRPSATGPRMLTITAERLTSDPIGAHWADGLASIPTRGLEAYGDTDAPLLGAGCLSDPDALAAFDDRAAQVISVLRPHLR